MKKLLFSKSKTLKLTNVIKYKISINNNEFDIGVIIEQMRSYINSKGAMQIGPLVQYTRTFINEYEELDIEIIIMLQCDRFIDNVGEPYSMESVIRIPNALYCRYIGPESSLKFAYDKISVEAFEEDIKLEDCNYTVFVDNHEEDIIVADVFIPKTDNE